MRVLLLKIHLLTGQCVEREPALTWSTQPYNAFLHSQRLDPSETEAERYNTPRCQVTSYRDAELLEASVRNKEVHMTQVPQNPPLFFVSVMASADSASRCPSWSTGDILTLLKPSSK